MKMYQRYCKRILDVIFSCIGIILAFPLFIIISILIQVKLGRPILFKQKRVSKDGKVFCMVKFRTMSEKRDELGDLLSNEKRLTKFGQILRSSSLDELPELINILKGDISFIGPRPLIPEYMPYYTEEELKRFLVKGGLIPPEILYNNVTPTWEEQFSYEIDYVDNVTFLLDLKILLVTAKGMFIRNSIEYGSYERPPFIIERTRQGEEEGIEIEVKNDKEIEKT
jgi:undecaprenyl phosphate N,N'-diacetylbacillosamine 1-phosphate transferase